MAVMGNLNYTYSAGVKPSTVQAFIERAFLKYMMPELVHTRDDQKRTLPMHEGSKSVQYVMLSRNASRMTLKSVAANVKRKGIAQVANC